MAAKGPTVERRHRLAIAELVRARYGVAGSATWDWVETGTWKGSRELDGLMESFAQALASGEAAAAERAWNEGYSMGYIYIKGDRSENPYRLPKGPTK